MKREIIAHFFQWEISKVTEVLNEVKNNGFTAIQLAPIQPCKEGNEFWTLYQPLDFTIGNKLGSKNDLIQLCNEAHKRDIKIIMDVVLRHTAGVNTGELKPHENVSKRLTENKNFWTNAENTTDYNNRWCVTNMAFGMPMLNYNNEELQQIYIEYLSQLKECGVDGFRVDMGKHFSLPDEGSDFWKTVFGKFSDMFNYAECLECKSELLDKYAKVMNVITDHDMPSDRHKAVLFVESHDTYYTFKSTTYVSDDEIINRYENLLKNNTNSNVLFFMRPFNDTWRNEKIKYLNNRYI